jgi:hypothetical protein
MQVLGERATEREHTLEGPWHFATSQVLQSLGEQLNVISGECAFQNPVFWMRIPLQPTTHTH